MEEEGEEGEGEGEEEGEGEGSGGEERKVDKDGEEGRRDGPRGEGIGNRRHPNNVDMMEVCKLTVYHTHTHTHTHTRTITCMFILSNIP